MKRFSIFHFLFSILLTVSVISAKGQSTTINFDPKFKTFEDSLKSLSFKIINSTDEVIRRNSNNLFIKTLVATLKLPNSFEYPFDSVVSVSILKSEDKVFRVFTWHLYSDDGSYRYYGAIQKNNKEKLELYPLFDNSKYIPKAEDTILTKDSWYGAHYYSIIETKKSPKNKQYVMLGWKGDNIKINQKVIDVLSFDKEGKPVFGAPIFNYGDSVKTRVIFKYARTVSMMLRYLPSKKWIVYDHLACPNATQLGMYEFYGPDLSYDGLKFKRKKWYLMEKIDLRNEKSEMDKLFNDPREDN